MRFSLLTFISLASLTFGSGCAGQDSSDGNRKPASVDATCEAPCFARFAGHIRALAFTEDRVIVLVIGDDDRIVSLDADGRDPITLVESTSSILDITVAQDAVFFASSGKRGPTRLSRVPPTGGLIEEVAPLKGAVALLGHDAWIVATTLDRNFTVVPLDGSEPPTLAGGGMSVITAVALDPSDLYWVGSDQAKHQDLFASPRDGGPSRRLVTTNFIAGAAIDDTDVYVADGWIPKHGPIEGAVLRIPKGGGPPETLVTEPVQNVSLANLSSRGLAVDTAFVYFSNGDTVFALAKDGSGPPKKFATIQATRIAAGPADLFFVAGSDEEMLVRQKKLAP